MTNICLIFQEHHYARHFKILFVQENITRLKKDDSFVLFWEHHYLHLISEVFSEVQTHILPRSYQTSKPNNKGYSLIREEWMQSFLKTIEGYVLHYLQNLCEDQIQKKLALFHIQLSKRLIPDCLRMGDTGFTHTCLSL